MASLIDNIANAYDESSAYVVGNYVINNKLLYKCLEATTGTFDESKWEKAYMTDLMGGGTTVEEFKSIAQEYVSTETYDKDAVILKNDKLYQCNTDGTTGSWDSDKWDEVLIPDISQNSNLANENEVVYSQANGSYTSGTNNDLIVVSSTGGVWDVDYEPSFSGGTVTEIQFIKNFHDTWSCQTHVYRWSNSKGSTVTFSKPLDTSNRPITMVIIK